MTTWGIRDSVVEDVHRLQSNLRDADLKELKAHKAGPTTALMHGLFRSVPKCRTLTVEGKPAAMFGIVPGLDPQFGAVWLLGTDDILKIKKSFLVSSKPILDEISQGYQLIYNVVHDKNYVHIRWLKWMGFLFLRHVPPFIEFCKLTHV